nr:30S ribosomal protein [Ipomoea batatas]GME17081.1 30S ribosomal protein [Ipomoea batatas]
MCSTDYFLCRTMQRRRKAGGGREAMSTTIITDSVVVKAAAMAAEAYIETIRERYQGKWICGLCAEAVKDEIVRSESERLISAEEALARHLNFCKKFRSTTPPPNPAVHLIAAMKQILRRSSESLKVRSLPSSPTKNNGVNINRRSVLSRTESCIPILPPLAHIISRNLRDQNSYILRLILSLKAPAEHAFGMSKNISSTHPIHWLVCNAKSQTSP